VRSGSTVTTIIFHNETRNTIAVIEVSKSLSEFRNVDNSLSNTTNHRSLDVTSTSSAVSVDIIVISVLANSKGVHDFVDKKVHVFLVE